MQTIIKHGSLAGVAITVYLLFLQLTGLYANDILSNLDAVLLIVAIVLVSRAYRRLHGALSYLRGVGIGMLITLLTGVISRLYYFIMLRYVDRGLFDYMEEQRRAMLAAAGKSAEEIVQVMAGINYEAGSFAWNNFIAWSIQGLVLSLVIAIFTRQRAA